MLKDKSSVFTTENEVTLNEYNPNKDVFNTSYFTVFTFWKSINDGIDE